MNIDFNNISDTYGDDIVNLIRDNVDDVMENINYLKKLNINCVDEIFEMYAIIFINTPSYFREKVNELINELGSNYIDIIENNLFVFEKLLFD